MDFNQFVVTGPSINAAKVGKTKQGVLQLVTAAATTALSVSAQNQCLTDTFTVTNPGGNVPPAICGTNTNDHSE